MNVLVACEVSGVVREAFRKRGHNAWSCDILPTAIPGPHYQGDVRDLLHPSILKDFNLMIAHPPCTYLSTCGNRHLNQPGRLEARQEAFDFFMQLACASVPRICMENPHGCVNTHWRKPDQTIHPWYFGDPNMKRTGLWLKNLPLLQYDLTKYEKPKPMYYTPDGRPKYWTHKTKDHNKGTSSSERSITSWAIAEAMAEQWGSL